MWSMLRADNNPKLNTNPQFDPLHLATSSETMEHGLEGRQRLENRLCSPITPGSRTWSWVCCISGRITEHGSLVPQVVDNKINKFRHVILEILHRLPNNEVLKPFVQELLLLVMNVVDVDNEENAIQGLRVIFDLQKNYRPQLEAEVPRFLQVSHGEGLQDRARRCAPDALTVRYAHMRGDVEHKRRWC